MEAKVQKAWADARVFEVDAPEDYADSKQPKEKYLVTFPYPYMNGTSAFDRCSSRGGSVQGSCLCQVCCTWVMHSLCPKRSLRRDTSVFEESECCFPSGSTVPACLSRYVNHELLLCAEYRTVCDADHGSWRRHVRTS